jgi:hypothetical protein
MGHETLIEDHRIQVAIHKDRKTLPSNSLKHSANLYILPAFSSVILHFAHKEYLWGWYDSENKERLFP